MKPKGLFGTKHIFFYNAGHYQNIFFKIYSSKIELEKLFVLKTRNLITKLLIVWDDKSK